MKPKVAFLTTIFPMERQYVLDFLNSLSRQTYTDFDVIVVNDGYEDFAEIRSAYKNLSIVEIKSQKTPAKNRELGIGFVKNNNYDILSGTDGNDDLFATQSVNIMQGGDGADNFVWTKATVNAGNTDEVRDFNSAEGDTLDLSDLLSDSSHNIIGLAEPDTDGAGQHLRLSITDSTSNAVVQTIDLDSVAVGGTGGPTAAQMLIDLIDTGNIID